MKRPQKGGLRDRLPGMVNAMMTGQLVNSKFLRYYAWLEGAHGALSLVVDNPSSSLFPCSLPYPEVFHSGKSLGHSLDRSTWAKRHMNAIIAWCNYVELGCPECGVGVCEPQANYQSEKFARRLADRLLGEVEQFGLEDVFNGSLELTGGRRAVEEAFDQVACTVPGYAFPHTESNLSGALEVRAERIAVPEVAGGVNPSNVLPPDRREVFDNMVSLRRPEALWDVVVPACHRVPPEEEAGLMRKLLKHKMVVMIPERDLPRDSLGRLLSAGLFCVPKNETEDRLILDRRPQNATMDRIHWASLPSGACFGKLLLQPHEYLRGSGDDLRNYYFALELPSNWIGYNSVGRRLDPAVVAEFGGEVGVDYRACFRVLGMGDRNACDIAQATHEAVLERVGLLSSSTKLIYGQHTPSGRIMEGVYLDDLLVVQKCEYDQPVPLDGTFIPPPLDDADEDQQRIRLAELAYAQAGLPRAEHKAFRGLTEFKAWGAEVKGVEGTVGAPKVFRQQTWILLGKVVKLGFCTRNILQKLLGYVCFIFQFRREMYSLQHHIYKFVQGMPNHGWRRLPGFVIDELRSIGLHLPFCIWDMRRELHTSLLSTDATPTSAGAARAEVPSELASELWKLSEVKGAAVRLDESDWERMQREWSAPKEPSAWASCLGKCLEWRAVNGYSFRQTSHINLQEGRALKNEIKRLARDETSFGKIQLCLNDSQVICGAFAKGRSSSFKLNGLMRGLLPYLLFANICLALIRIETESNPADHPSRFRAIPPPRDGPLWLRKFNLGFRNNIGWELFSGSGRLTAAHIKAGVQMLDPVDILFGGDIFDRSIEDSILLRLMKWVWLAPPCGSFSPLRNLDYYGPLRPKGNPAGDESNPEVALGNRLWRRALFLAELCFGLGIYFFIEHPRGSKAWQLKETKRLMDLTGASLYEVHWCMYEDRERVGLPNRKPTRVLTTAPWFKEVIRTCNGQHFHGPPLRGKRAKLAGAYPWGFCDELAAACKRWW